MRQRTGRILAKGTSRRVVIVPGEEDSVFEQIICVVRDDSLSQRGVSAEHILREAEELLHLHESDNMEDTPRLFSGVVLILMLVAFFLTAAILIYLHLHGLS